MKVAVSYDEKGEVTLMFHPASMQHAEYTVGYEPAPGEMHQVFDVPTNLEGKPVSELARSVRVNVSNGIAKLEARA
jgi:hypothetical protein